MAKPKQSLAATPRWRLKHWHQIAQTAKQPAIYTCRSPADLRLSVSSTPTFCSLTQKHTNKQTHKHKNTKTQKHIPTIIQLRTLSDLAASRVTFNRTSTHCQRYTSRAHTPITDQKATPDTSTPSHLMPCQIAQRKQRSGIMFPILSVTQTNIEKLPPMVFSLIRSLEI